MLTKIQKHNRKLSRAMEVQQVEVERKLPRGGIVSEMKREQAHAAMNRQNRQQMALELLRLGLISLPKRERVAAILRGRDNG